ncbi:M48 family metallopeptidase [Flavihumibacter sp. UBA7668]|uniref:M48 family metallopeptidase n=1 Tax=Flavihumibacter sp. UBA7668 TaxID=1946542 RepID=UPI0025C23410|nr:M48 family metallopeptidase [Flavihumibacter sp. UBA7668]
MLDKQHEVWFQSSLVNPAKLVRVLLFDQAIQLYDANDESFLGAYELEAIRLQEKNDQYAKLSLLPGNTDILTISDAHLLLPEILERINGSRNVGKKIRRNWKWPVVFIGIAAFLVAAYFGLISLLTSVGLHLVSIEKEKELGDMIFHSMADGLKIDTISSRSLKRFAGHLQLSTDYPLEFTVVDDTTINAFAIPGGHIVVYKGILNEMKDPEELVALLGHEASHINERHSLRSILRQLSGSVLLTMVFGDLGSIGASIAGQADHLRTLSYSRSLEEEADQKGMEIMMSNKINPQGMVGLMDRLQKADSGTALPGFLSTHPLTSERKKTAIQFIKEHPVDFETPTALLTEWKQVQQPSPNEW